MLYASFKFKSYGKLSLYKIQLISPEILDQQTVKLCSLT